MATSVTKNEKSLNPVRKPIPKGQLLIDGKWRDSADGATSNTIDPTTEEVITEAARATAADAKAAVQAAFRARALLEVKNLAHHLPGHPVPVW